MRGPNAYKCDNCGKVDSVTAISGRTPWLSVKPLIGPHTDYPGAPVLLRFPSTFCSPGCLVERFYDVADR